jgi:signal transduction histidine kinase
VRDSGPGVRGEQLARIFDPLFTTKPLGSGLGLAVVSRIAERHGGFVSVSSRPGEGACFELFLPAR